MVRFQRFVLRRKRMRYLIANMVQRYTSRHLATFFFTWRTAAIADARVREMQARRILPHSS